ncbi:hypothetical protein [Desulfitobacterium sp. AusDCA]|uniref:hypothetical protein n=1 Tax=Desulfitobacterium sp. AusDCA TaxID=3240383 RepID=UPI003DA6DE61
MKRKLLILTLIMTFLIYSVPVRAADNLTWDNNYERSRSTTDQMGQLYNAKPIKIPIGDAVGSWLYSYSTPIVYGNTLYEYVWNTDSNIGYLVAVDISKTNPTSAADFPVLWKAKFQVESDERVDGSPGPSISPDGKYMSMAVGKYLYTWPMSINGNQNIQDSNLTHKYVIWGNNNQSTNMIAMSPAISSANYSWAGVDKNTFETVTFTAPMTCAGSWNGGFIAAPLYAPENVDPNLVQYFNVKTTDIDSAWTGEIFTSSPAIMGNGNGNVLFGVDGGYPVLFDFYPSSMTLDYFGGGVIQYGIASAPAIDPSTGHVYVPDKMGNVYHYGSDLGYINKNTDLSTGDLIISNVAVDNNYVYAVKAGHSEVHAIDKYSMSDVATIFSNASGFIDPSVVINPSTGVSIAAVNDAAGYIHLSSVSSSMSGPFLGSGGLSTSAQGSPPPPYVAVLMDAGPNQLIASWTDDIVDGAVENGALEFWVPTVSQLTATVNPSTNQPNAMTTLYVDTTVDNQMSEVVAQLPDASGNPVPINEATSMTYISSSPGPNGSTIYHYQLQFRVPGSPGDYNIPVQLRYTVPGNTADPVNGSAPYKVVKPAGGVVQDGGATLTLGSYALPENRIKSNDEFKPWPRSQLQKQHPAGTTFLGDTILADLSVDTPALPDASDRLVSAYLTQASVTRPEGYDDGTKWSTHIIDEPMQTNGMTATLQFEETWAGWQPGNYVADTPDWAYNAPTLKSPDWQGEIDVDYVIHVVYQYPVYVTSSIPDGNGGVVTSVSIIWETAEMDVPGTTSASLTSWGTDFVVVPVTAGNSYS